MSIMYKIRQRGIGWAFGNSKVALLWKEAFAMGRVRHYDIFVTAFSGAIHFDHSALVSL